MKYCLLKTYPLLLEPLLNMSVNFFFKFFLSRLMSSLMLTSDPEVCKKQRQCLVIVNFSSLQPPLPPFSSLNIDYYLCDIYLKWKLVWTVGIINACGLGQLCCQLLNYSCAVLFISVQHFTLCWSTWESAEINQAIFFKLFF